MDALRPPFPWLAMAKCFDQCRVLLICLSQIMESRVNNQFLLGSQLFGSLAFELFRVSWRCPFNPHVKLLAGDLRTPQFLAS